MWQDRPAELMFALILVGIRCSGSTQEGDTQNIAAAREAVFALGKDRDAVAELAEVRKLSRDE